MNTFPRIILNKGKERSLKNFHPWVFSGAVKSAEDGIGEGDIAEVFSADGNYLGTGHYHEGSIKVRLFSFERTDAGPDFWLQKIKAAYTLRESLGLARNEHTNAYRLVHAEGDSMPGLILDIYHEAAVIQTHTLGMQKAIPFISKALKEIYGDRLKVIYDKSAEALSKQHIRGATNQYLLGSESSAVVLENDLKFQVNWEEGQKTGFFIDQRENRKLLASYCKGKTVVNAFAYSAGFSVYALAAGALHVDSVDSSKRAAEWAEKNVALNFTGASHQFHCEDVFDYFKKNHDEADVLVLDPPGFAKHLSAVNQASIGYRNLNAEGIKKVKKGGILFTFSCSQVIDRTLFRKLVFQAAAQTGRQVRILHQLSQPPDHPINLYHPEGEYLKGLVLRVE